MELVQIVKELYHLFFALNVYFIINYDFGHSIRWWSFFYV